MGMSIEQFTKEVEQSGILAAELLSEIAPSKSIAENADDLARELVRKKLLTRYQAEAIHQGNGKSLKLGNYVLLDKIGAGGMGQVFKAQHRRMKRVVAIKLLPSSLSTDKDAIARFEREVEAAAKINHPNIVAAYDADCANGIHFLVMEFVEGSDLSALIRSKGPLPIAKAIDYITQAARGLDVAHKKGIIHRDIKPANLLLGSDGIVKILDMGLARLNNPLDGAQPMDLTTTGLLMGTIDYMSPEQALSTKTADERADIYSLGCTLWYLLMGRSIYEGESMMAKLLAHREQPIPSLRSGQRNVPPPIDDIFQKMVAKNASDRYQSISELMADLEQCRFGEEPTIVINEFATQSTKRNAEFVAGDPPMTQTLALDNPSLRPAINTDAHTSIRNRRWLMGAAGLVASFMLLAGIVVSLKTKEGTLVVTVSEADADVQVLNEQEQIEVTRKGDKGPITIALDPGKHRLKVTKDGFEFFTQDFSIEAGASQSVSAKLIPLAEKPADVADVSQEASIDRSVAEWVQSVGGTLQIVVDDKTITVPSTSPLPDAPFLIHDIDLKYLSYKTDKKVDLNKEISRLVGLSSLDGLQLDGNPVTDEGLACIGSISSLKKLTLGATSISDASAPVMASLPNLRYLVVSTTRATPAILPGLAKCKKLYFVTCEWPHSKSAAIDLTALPSLTGVELHESWLNEEAVELLRQKPMYQIGIRFNGQLSDDRIKLLTRFAGLTVLEFRNHETIYDLSILPTGFENLASLPKLRRLAMSGFTLTDDQASAIAKISNLESIACIHHGTSPGSTLTDTGLAYFSMMPKLRSIELTRTKITPSGLAKFREAKPECQVTTDVK